MRAVWAAIFVHVLMALHVRAEMFTALVEMESLLNTEEELIYFLNNYISQEEARIQKLRLYLQDYEKQKVDASRDIQKYLQNPVNAYLLVKRLSSDWKEVERLMQENAVLVQNFSQRKEAFKFPDDEDLTGAAAALMRLQDTYKLETAALARGEIQGTAHTSELKGSDCFELGRQAYNSGDHYHTVLWMQEALERVESEKNASISETDILEYLAYSTFMQGNVRHALKLTNDLLQLAPNHARAAGNLVYYEDAINKAEAKKRGDDGDVTVDTSYVEKVVDTTEYAEKDLYERLCRGEKTMGTYNPTEGCWMVNCPMDVDEYLMVETQGIGQLGQPTCRYFTNNHPYYLLQPFMEEEMSARPRIVVYHNLMRDDEIEVVKHLAEPRLARATVQNYKSGELEVANYRISKSAWLKGEDHPIVARVNRRLQALTGLDMNTAEELQVVNYGIGGHYEPHYDFARREEVNAFKSLGTGNRIATVLFYMSDVEAGGATVFPQIGLSLWPRKGSAAFWYNLHRSGDGDLLTRHAACPVLAGTKWVSNKWIHERGQEFRHPCGLKLTDV